MLLSILTQLLGILSKYFFWQREKQHLLSSVYFLIYSIKNNSLYVDLPITLLSLLFTTFLHPPCHCPDWSGPLRRPLTLSHCCVLSHLIHCANSSMLEAGRKAS